MKLAIPFCIAASILSAQSVTEADYQRANGLRQKMQGLALNVTGPMNWIGASDRFWYRKSVAGGNVFVVMNASTLEKSAAFDHDRLAKALGEKYTGLTLPFTEFTFLDDHAIQFVMTGSNWRCDLDNYSCRNTGPVPSGFGRGGRPPEDDSPAEFENDVEDGMVSPQQGQRALGAETAESRIKASPDGKWEAVIQNYNVFVRAKGKTRLPLSLGRIGRKLLHVPVDRLVAGFETAGRLSRAAGLSNARFTTSNRRPRISCSRSIRRASTRSQAMHWISRNRCCSTSTTRKQIMIDDALFPNPYQPDAAGVAEG